MESRKLVILFSITAINNAPNDEVTLNNVITCKKLEKYFGTSQDGVSLFVGNNESIAKDSPTLTFICDLSSISITKFLFFAHIHSIKKKNRN